MSPVSLRVRDFREKKGISQRELSRLTGLSQKALSAIETGKSKGVDFDTLDRLATALEVEPALLVVRHVHAAPRSKSTTKRSRRGG